MVFQLPTGAMFINNINVVSPMGFEPIASQSLNLSGLPIAYRDI
jgi:hypothetical protein